MNPANHQPYNGIPSRRSQKGFCCLLALMCVVVLACPRVGLAESAKSLYDKGQKAEAQQQYEAAYEFFKAAYDQKPNDIAYRTSFERARFYAAMVKVHRGQLLREQGKFDEALAQFQAAVQMNPSLEIATQEINATKELMQTGGAPSPAPAKPRGEISEMLSTAQGPVVLEPISQQPITLKLTEDSRVIYETIGKLAGINVLFDPDYTSRRIHIELNNVSLQDALQIIALESRTFWQPVTKNTIFIAADNPQKRKELEEDVVKTFYLSNVSQPTDLQDIVNALRTILEIQRLQQLPSQNAIVIRGTPDQLALAQKLITDIDKPKPEVVVDIAVMQVARNKMRTLGIEPPTNVSVALTNQSFQNLANSNNNTTTTTTSNNSNGTTNTNQQQPGGQVTFNTFKHLTSVSYAVNLPPASAQFLFSNSDSQIIQNPQIRSIDGQKASLKIGDRVPVATGSFGIPSIASGTAGGLGGFAGAVNTQFQYIDVGVNIEMTPTIHNDGDVSLKMSIDISSVTDHVNIGGIDQPVIGQRKIEHEIRLKDGEMNIMGGIFEDQEVKSWSGIPGLGQIPLFKYLFAQENKSDQKNEIVFVIIPHVLRQQVLTSVNSKALDVGSGSAIQLRLAQPEPESTDGGTASVQPAATNEPVTPVPTAAPVLTPAMVPVQQPAPTPAQALPAPNSAAQTSPPSVASRPMPPMMMRGQQQQTQPPPAEQNPVPATNGQTTATLGLSLRFDPPSVSQPAGSTAGIDISAQSSSPVSDVSMQLHYDPKLLQIINVGSGGFLSQDGQPATVVHRDDGNGTLQITAVRPPGAPGITGSGTLFTLVFALKGAGAAALAPVSLAAKDAKNQPMNATLAGQAVFQIQNRPAH